MRSFPSFLSLLALGLGLGLGVTLVLRLVPPRRAAPPDPPAVVERVREVARLEALDVSLYKKVTFAPEPSAADSLWGDVAGWLRHTFHEPRGKALVFADAHIGIDLSRLGPDALVVHGRSVDVTLPPLRVQVELRPADTEIIGSNLDSAETAHLLELARVAFENEVSADKALRARARAAAERAIRSLLLSVGFEAVRFVDGEPGRG
jgi:hypothetical protein